MIEKTTTLYARVPVAYRPPGHDDPFLPVHLRPGVEYQPGDEIDDRIPDWVRSSWLQDGRIAETLPHDLPKPPADPKRYPSDPRDVLSRPVWELQSGTRDRLKEIIQAVARVEDVSMDEARVRAHAAINLVGDQAPIRAALKQAGMDVARIAAALPAARAERAVAQTERERGQWEAAVRETA